jgi:hypothetical protein
LAGYYKKGRLRAAAGLGRTEELVHLMAYLQHGENIPFEEFANAKLRR